MTTIRSNRSTNHRKAIGLVGAVALLTLTTSVVAARDAGTDPELEIDAPQITGVAPLDGQLESAPTVTAYDAMIADLQRGAVERAAPTVTAYDAMIADLQARFEDD